MNQPEDHSPAPTTPNAYERFLKNQELQWKYVSTYGPIPFTPEGFRQFEEWKLRTNSATTVENKGGTE